MPDPPPVPSPEPSPLTPQDRRKVARAAALRPLNLLVLIVGAVFFVSTLTWWIPLLTLATYATLVFLGTRDPILQRRTLGLEPPPTRQEQELPPERRARWLPRGETRQKVDDALAEYRKVVAAIETSDDVTRTVLEDTVPRLHAAANRLVDVALQREKAERNVRELRTKPGSGARAGDIQRLQTRVDEADAEISATHEELIDLRAKVVRISIDTDDTRQAAALNASLDELNARLDALGDMTSP